jgi:hypothetical protein
MKNKNDMLKYLLATAMVGIFTFAGLLQGNLLAAENPTVQINPDGSKMIQDADGSTIQIKPDGTKIIKKQDGATVQVKPDGSKFIQSADGTIVEVKPDGTKIIKKPDGTSVQVKPSQGQGKHAEDDFFENAH